MDSWVTKIRWRRNRLPTPVFLGFPDGSDGKESACNAGELGSIPGVGRGPGEVKGYLLQYSGLESSMGCIVHGVAKSRTRLSRLHFTSAIRRLPLWLSGKESVCRAGAPGEASSIPGSGRSPGMATHSSILAWRIPWTEEPGGLWPMESQRVGQD